MQPPQRRRLVQDGIVVIGDVRRRLPVVLQPRLLPHRVDHLPAVRPGPPQCPIRGPRQPIEQLPLVLRQRILSGRQRGLETVQLRGVSRRDVLAGHRVDFELFVLHLRQQAAQLLLHRFRSQQCFLPMELLARIRAEPSLSQLFGLSDAASQFTLGSRRKPVFLEM